MSALSLPLVTLVTDRTVAGGIDALLEKVARAAEGGALSIVQMREKDLPDAEQFAIARGLREATSGRAMLFINDSVSIAQAVGADGVHLAEASRSIASARERAGSALYIGRSVHSADAAAESAGADFVHLGPIHATPSHPDAAPAGVGLIADAASAGSPPIVAVGGIDAANAAEAIAAGASGVAVIREVLGAADPARAAGALRSAVESAWARRQGGTA